MSGTEDLIMAECADENDGGEENDDLDTMEKNLEKAKEEKAELDKLNKLQGGGGAAPTENADSAERDGRSIFIGNVDFSCSVEELQELFNDCGEINAITIPVDKHTGRAKGFAYLEFAEKGAVEKAIEKNGHLLRDRAIKVVNKRTNLPIWQVLPTRGRGRGRGRGFPPPFRARGRGGFRGGRGSHYHPYY